MFGIDKILSSPAIVHAAAKATGIEAARLDVHPQRGELVASLRIRGQVRQYPIPTGRTFILEEILSILFPEASGPQPARETPAITASPP
jgi:hypothetical protein